MISLWFWSIVVALLIGLAAKYGFSVADKTRTYQISWIEFAIVMAIISVIVVPVTTKVGLKLAKASKLTYHEFWGGYETAALHSSQSCSRDGSCRDTYDCDPYIVIVTMTSTDSKGNVTTTEVPETHYHSCPVATDENYWKISTTLGDYDLGMTFDPQAVPYRSSHGLDGTPEGPPALWTAAKERVDAGTPGPVTADKTYSNYILASTRTILHKFSDAVARYQKARLLPDPVVNLDHPIYDYYYADKMQFVSIPGNHHDWELALARLNAALGSALQGDLHVVAVDATKISNPDEYTGAVNADWQGKTLGRRALSKNGIGLVLGVTGEKIVWARAFTGMPVGNDGLTLDLQNNLTGIAFTPTIFGDPVGHIVNGKASVTHGDSPVEAALWGPHAFHRVCMVCKSKGDTGVGYGYLGSEIQPSSGQKLTIIFVAVLFSMVFWAIALFTVVGESNPKKEPSW